jgi:hypothetical protein
MLVYFQAQWDVLDETLGKRVTSITQDIKQEPKNVQEQLQLLPAACLNNGGTI